MLGINVNEMYVVNKCPVCDSERQLDFGQSEDYLVSREVFILVQCLECGFVFTNPRPALEDLPCYYKSGDYISHTDSRKSFFERVYGLVKRHMLRRKAQIINKLTQKKKFRILDYGCATGDLLLFLQNKGAIGLGYEPDAGARNKANLKGVSVLSNDTELLTDNYRGKFDVITLWHVLEHIPDLQSKVKMFSELLGENGVIVVAVPEYKSYDAQYYGFKWAAWDVPRHLNHFERKSLTLLFEKNGFTLEKKYPLVFDSFYVSMLTEKNKHRRTFGMVRAFLIGFYSNFKALLGSRPYSSQIYVFRKQ
jgi:SAM-dependent methyltransferase